MGEMLVLAGLELPAGPRLRASRRMIEHMRDEKRLSIEDEPMAELLFKLAETLDTATAGRGASIALVSAQFKDVWKELKQLQAPVEADTEEFDVVLLPVIADAS